MINGIDTAKEKVLMHLFDNPGAVTVCCQRVMIFNTDTRQSMLMSDVVAKTEWEKEENWKSREAIISVTHNHLFYSKENNLKLKSIFLKKVQTEVWK